MDSHELVFGRYSLNQKARIIIRESTNRGGFQKFSYYGKLPVGESWALTFETGRDADCMTRSNWEVITDTFEKKHPHSYEIVGASDDLFGYRDILAVKMIDKNGRITRAGKTVLELLEQLESYPVLDEMHYCQLEYDEKSETMRESIRCDAPMLKDDLPDNWIDLVHKHIEKQDRTAWDHAFYECDGWLDKETIESACEALGYLDSDE